MTDLRLERDGAAEVQQILDLLAAGEVTLSNVEVFTIVDLRDDLGGTPI
jgi:hypothetical protein